MRGLLPQVKRVHLIAACKGTAHAPLHALAGNTLVNSQALEDLQRFLCIANPARRGTLDTHRVVFVQQQRPHAVLRQRTGQREASDAAAHNHNGVTLELTGGYFRRLHKRVFRQLVTAALGKFIAVGECRGCISCGYCLHWKYVCVLWP